MAAVYASLALALIVFTAAPLIAYLPIPAVAGALVLVGIGLLDARELKRLRHSRQETVIFGLTFAAALAFGLNAGVLTGVLVSLAVYLRYAATPSIHIEDYPARDGRRVYAVTVNGSLFFGSLRTLEHALAGVVSRAGERAVLLLHTDHVTYLDVPGAAWLAAEAERRRRAGVEFYVHVTRAPVLDTLERSGALARIGADHVIQRDRGHPLKSVLFPLHVPLAAVPASAPAAEAVPPTHSGEPNMDEIARRLRASRLLSLLSPDQLRLLLAHSELRRAREGEVIIAPDTSLDAHLVLIEGELEVERLWVGADGREQASTRRATPLTASGEVTLVTATRGLRVTARRASRYLLINADRVDELLEWSQQVSSVPDEDARIKRRMAIVKQVSVFRQLPLENARAAFEHMRPQVAAAGETSSSRKTRRSLLLIEWQAEVWYRPAHGCNGVRGGTRAGRRVRRERCWRLPQCHGQDAHPRRLPAEQGVRRAGAARTGAGGRARGRAGARGRRPRAVAGLPLRHGVRGGPHPGRAARAARSPARNRGDARPGGHVHRVLPQWPAQPGGGLPAARTQYPRAVASRRDQGLAL
jgi:anti-anti-sigma regulatory factor